MNLLAKSILFILLTLTHLIHEATCSFPSWIDNNDPNNSLYDVKIIYDQDGQLQHLTLRLATQDPDNKDVLKVNHVFPQAISVVAASILDGPRGIACLFMFRPTKPADESYIKAKGTVFHNDDYYDDYHDGEEEEDDDDGDDDDGDGDDDGNNETSRSKRMAPTRAEILPFSFVSRREAKEFNEIFCTAPAFQDLLQ